jgi:hypothetical protein
MPALENPKYEKACQLRANGLSFKDAYQGAFGGDVPQNNTTRLFRRPEIKARLAEIAHERAVMANFNEFFILEQLKAIASNGVKVGKKIAEALENDNPAAVQQLQSLRSAHAVVQANELLGRYFGMWSDKSAPEATGGGRTIVEVYWGGTPQEQVTQEQVTQEQQPREPLKLINGSKWWEE